MLDKTSREPASADVEDAVVSELGTDIVELLGNHRKANETWVS